MLIKLIKASALSVALLLSSTATVFADIAVVVNLENKSDLDVVMVRKIFLGKLKSFPNGNAVATFDLPDANPARAEFNKTILRKSESRLNSYWARMLFSSKAKPPTLLNSADDVKAAVASNINAIAYLNEDDVDASVRVLLTKKSAD